ncbi:MAG: hypothetical protein P4L41_07840 [Flavipsychrobacter sp.]|nr:hypothetical protein [Flavipsychrobacter sp.]
MNDATALRASETPEGLEGIALLTELMRGLEVVSSLRSALIDIELSFAAADECNPRKARKRGGKKGAKRAPRCPSA